MKKREGSNCGDLFVVRTRNVDLSCKQLTSPYIWKSKYHIDKCDFGGFPPI